MLYEICPSSFFILQSNPSPTHLGLIPQTKTMSCAYALLPEEAMTAQIHMKLFLWIKSFCPLEGEYKNTILGGNSAYISHRNQLFLDNKSI